MTAFESYRPVSSIAHEGAILQLMDSYDPGGALGWLVSLERDHTQLFWLVPIGLPTILFFLSCCIALMEPKRASKTWKLGVATLVAAIVSFALPLVVFFAVAIDQSIGTQAHAYAHSQELASAAEERAHERYAIEVNGADVVSTINQGNGAT